MKTELVVGMPSIKKSIVVGAWNLGRCPAGRWKHWNWGVEFRDFFLMNLR